MATPVDLNENMQHQILPMLVALTAQVAAIDAKIGGVSSDQTAVRERLHELTNKLQPLMILPERMKDMADQHRQMKQQMDEVSGRLRVLEPLPERVAKLEPLVDGLVATQNQAKGAGWVGRVAAGLIGALGAALGAALSYLSFLRHP